MCSVTSHIKSYFNAGSVHSVLSRSLIQESFMEDDWPLCDLWTALTFSTSFLTFTFFSCICSIKKYFSPGQWGSVGWSIVLCTERSRVWSQSAHTPVRACRRGNQWCFTPSLSLPSALSKIIKHVFQLKYHTPNFTKYVSLMDFPKTYVWFYPKSKH